MSKPVSSKSSRVFSNLLQQNVFVRDVSRAVDLKSDSSAESTFLSLDEVVDDSGVKIVKNPVDYPITPAYVASFADSADYRRDPANAVANGVKRTNLGDCTDFQKICAMDSNAQFELYNQLKAKFSKASASNSAVSNVSTTTITGGENNG